MSFFSTREIAFGLDIADRSLRLIQLKGSQRKPKIQLYNEVDLPAGCLVNGEIKKPDIFIASLNQLIKKRHGHGQISREAIIALPEDNSFLKILEIEAENEAAIPDQIEKILPQNLPLEMSEIYWDYQITKREEGKFQVLIGCSPKNIVDDYLKVFATCGIIPVVMEIEAASIARVLINLNKQKDAQIVIDIGHNRTGLFLYDGQTVIVSVTLPLSGNEINKIIAESLDLTPDQAEKAKIACGLNDKKCQGAILELLAPAIEELAKQILNAVNYYYENYPEPMEIKKIVLCGGGANTANIATVLEKAVEIPTVLSQPLVNFGSIDKAFFTEHKTQSFVTALGLGLRGLNPESFYDHA